MSSIFHTIITCTSTDTNNDPMELPYGDANLYTWDTMVFLLPAILAREGIKGITQKLILLASGADSRALVDIICWYYHSCQLLFYKPI
jgi:hypothetical protein